MNSTAKVGSVRTPGPWLVSDGAVADMAVDHAIYVILDGQRQIIAECFGRSSWEHAFPSAANAAFIAKAANTYDELVAALSEFTGENLSDVRALADKLHQNNHRVTGTEAERISYLLHYLERSVRVARAALAKAQQP